MDMIVVGSRGLSRSAAAILGSTAERVLTCSPLPVLIVKRKGETVHLLDALLGGR
jgi:nucleotide-binding universal stress UspA family protein